MKKKLISAVLLVSVLLCLSMPVHARPGGGVGEDPVEGPQPWFMPLHASPGGGAGEDPVEGHQPSSIEIFIAE